MEKEEKYVSYFNSIAGEDVEDILTIGSTTCSLLYNKFGAKLEDPKLVCAIFAKTYETIVDYLKSCQTGNNKDNKKYTEMEIDICERLMMGYTTNDNEDDEKSGNFAFFIRDLGCTKKDEKMDDFNASKKERYVYWTTNNCIENPETLKNIADVTIGRLEKDIDVHLGIAECVFPFFITTYEACVNYVNIKRAEEDQFEYTINFLGCFDITSRETADDPKAEVGSMIYLKQNIAEKLGFKDDQTATATKE